MHIPNVDKVDKDSEQLRLLMASVSALNDIVLITEADPIDPPGPRIVFVNEAFEQLTGYTAEEVIGKNPRMLQGEKTDRKQLDMIRAALVAGEPSRSEIYNYSKDGRGYWLEINMVPIFDQDKKLTHFVAVERDITNRKQLELEMQNNMKELEKMNKLFVDRELKMAALKEEIAKLKKLLQEK